MKKYLTFSLMAVLVSLLAVSAYAQSGTQTQNKVQPTEPVKAQTDEGPNGDGTATTERTRTSEATGLTEKSDVADKSGDQTQQMNYGTGDGNNHELGDNNRHGDEYTGETGPHGPASDGSDKSGDMPYGDNDGNNHELGDNNRHGDEYTGETGPHGFTELDKELLEFMGVDNMFGASADGNFAGSMFQHSWGPGECGAGGHTGPNDGSGFGPAGSDVRSGSSVTDPKGQGRGGRR